jgi:hypothetical protein
MTSCPSCGAENTDGTRFCVKCGTTLSTAPAPESWRAPSGDLNQTKVSDPPGSSPGGSAGGYAPQTPPASSYPTYTPPQGVSYQPQPAGGSSQPMHPAVPAIVSFFVPGIGLLFVPNKAGLGLGIFAGYVVLVFILIVLAVITLGIGSCLFFLLPLANVAAAIHSWDEAAKTSGGQFNPILFK